MILVCVDYGDLLEFTLPYNRHHFDDAMIVTSPGDLVTQNIALENHCQLHITDAFYRDGADFNKWRALEEGLDIFGRRGIICIMDADILWPKVIPQWVVNHDHLYTPMRRMMENIEHLRSVNVPPETLWSTFPLHRQQAEWAGYTQIFHGDDSHLGATPWHETNWSHAGGADSFFQAKWPKERKLRPPFEVLHLGTCGENWFGRSTQMVDGSIPRDSEERKHKFYAIWQQRRDNKANGIPEFTNEKIPQGQVPKGDC